MSRQGAACTIHINEQDGSEWSGKKGFLDPAGLAQRLPGEKRSNFAELLGLRRLR